MPAPAAQAFLAAAPGLQLSAWVTARWDCGAEARLDLALDRDEAAGWMAFQPGGAGCAPGWLAGAPGRRRGAPAAGLRLAGSQPGDAKGAFGGGCAVQRALLAGQGGGGQGLGMGMGRGGWTPLWRRRRLPAAQRPTAKAPAPLPLSQSTDAPRPDWRMPAAAGCGWPR